MKAMIYVGKPKRSGAPSPALRQSTNSWVLPHEPAKVSCARICDNRLRMIRAWTILGNDRRAAYLRSELNDQIRKWKFESDRTDTVWYDKLFELVGMINPANYDTFDPVYDHINKVKPRHVTF